MQAVGGVKVTNGWHWQKVYILANDNFELGTPEQRAARASIELGSYSSLHFERSVDNDGYFEGAGWDPIRRRNRDARYSSYTRLRTAGYSTRWR